MHDDDFVEDEGDEEYQEYDEESAQPYPFIGSDIERKEYTILMNEKLKFLCKKNNFGFIDIYDKYT
ncbi:MAG: hypothetical protein ACK55Z_35255, partial [bacterium]